ERIPFRFEDIPSRFESISRRFAEILRRFERIRGRCAEIAGDLKVRRGRAPPVRSALPVSDRHFDRKERKGEFPC
ncbi:MAG TPA: hypothetical protein VF266_04970, partial [Thermoanaerobaculia bacterium]